MGYLSQIAGLYALLFIVSLIFPNYWLQLAVILLGLFLIVILALMLDDVDKTKAEKEWVKEKIDSLEKEIEKLEKRLSGTGSES